MTDGGGQQLKSGPLEHAVLVEPDSPEVVRVRIGDGEGRLGGYSLHAVMVVQLQAAPYAQRSDNSLAAAASFSLSKTPAFSSNTTMGKFPEAAAA